MRADALEGVGAKQLYKESYPRLIHRENPMSVKTFRRIKSGPKLSDPSNTEIVTLYGRVDSIRRHGKGLMFVTIVNDFEKVQGMINFKALTKSPGLTIEAFKLFAMLIERGDHISLTGMSTRTSAGELTVDAVMLPELLSPAMEQIPEALTDPETRIQKRHIDMIVNPEVADTLRLRSSIIKYIRDYFHSKDFLEFQTPILAENAGGATARPFVTTATEFPDRALALRVAPELWLKRLVVGGVHKVFEIGPSFRNEGIDATHNPEFTMCESYSAYINLPDLIGQTEELLCGLANHCQQLIGDQFKSLQNIDASMYSKPFAQVEFVPALEEALGFRLPKLSDDDAYPEMVAVLKLAGVHVPGDIPQTLPKLLDRLAAVYLEPKSFTEPLFITNHPACMSPLAKSFLCPKTYQLVSARAELFVNGREIANMYEEENNPDSQAKKLAKHQTLGKNSVPGPLDEVELKSAPLDKSFVKVLNAGLPPTGGWGCGIDRLVMLFSGTNRIGDCLSFGSLRNVVNLSVATKPAAKVGDVDSQPKDTPGHSK